MFWAFFLLAYTRKCNCSQSSLPCCHDLAIIDTRSTSSYSIFFTCMKEQYLFSKNADHNSDGVRHATRQDLQLPAVVAVTCKILGTNLHIFLPVWNGFIIHQGLQNILWTAHLFPQVQNTCASIVFLVSPFTFQGWKVTEKTVAVFQAKRLTKTGIGRRQAITASSKRTMYKIYKDDLTVWDLPWAERTRVCGDIYTSE